MHVREIWGWGKLSTFKTIKVQEILENKMEKVGVCAIRLITVSTLATIFVIIRSARIEIIAEPMAHT